MKFTLNFAADRKTGALETDLPPGEVRPWWVSPIRMTFEPS